MEKPGNPQQEWFLVSQSLYTCWRKGGRVERLGQEWGAGRSLHPLTPRISTWGSIGLWMGAG